MAAPQYVPTTLEDQPRKGLSLPPADAWLADRPAEVGAHQPRGRGFGTAGPDQGYALKLARRFDDRLSVVAPEHHEDAVAGCLGVATKRAALFGRAPVIHDLGIAFRIWGFLGDAPDELVDLRQPLFVAAAHSYAQRREIADHVPDDTLRLSKDEVAGRFPAEWRVLLGR
ncbi:MAG: hypothetical protein JF603_15440 [Acidobacteria bacterium]|nr:hypothetical protein [Acidobacteriota bacterium]